MPKDAPLAIPEGVPMAEVYPEARSNAQGCALQVTQPEIWAVHLNEKRVSLGWANGHHRALAAIFSLVAWARAGRFLADAAGASVSISK